MEIREVQWSTVEYSSVQWSTVEYSGVLELLVFGYFKYSLSGLMGFLLILPLLVHRWLWPNPLSSVPCFCRAACEFLVLVGKVVMGTSTNICEMFHCGYPDDGHSLVCRAPLSFCTLSADVGSTIFLPRLRMVGSQVAQGQLP